MSRRSGYSLARADTDIRQEYTYDSGRGARLESSAEGSRDAASWHIGVSANLLRKA